MSNLSSRPVPPNVTLVSHPVADAAVTRLRICPGGEVYTRNMEVVGQFLAVEATKDLPTEPWKVTTRMSAHAPGVKLHGRVALVSITRGGNDLIAPFRRLLPDSSIYYVAARRVTTELDGKKKVHAKLIDSKLPQAMPKEIHTAIVLDPMFASGCSVELILELLEVYKLERIIFVCLMAAFEGIDLISQRWPNVQIITAQIEEKLDENFYMVPGIGDGSDVSCLTSHD